ncbi:MAG: hypothetical protein GXP45_00265 [bacterium]|nr:hypothetical protein [bacterium]
MKSNITVDSEGLKTKLKTSIQEKQIIIQKLNTQLDNSSFVNNAPEQVIADRRESLKKAKKDVESLQKELSNL